MYLLYLCLRQERQLQKVLYGCRVDVQGVFGKFLEVLQMQLQVLVVSPFLVAQIFLDKVVPRSPSPSLHQRGGVLSQSLNKREEP